MTTYIKFVAIIWSQYRVSNYLSTKEITATATTATLSYNQENLTEA